MIHPTITESMNRFMGCGKKIVFTRMNRTNPVLNRDGDLQSELERKGSSASARASHMTFVGFGVNSMIWFKDFLQVAFHHKC